MPGPSRFFVNQAARQRAYRVRKQEELTAELTEARDTYSYAYVVQAAVAAARKHGDPVAQQVYDPDPFQLLRALAEYFYDRAETPRTERPWQE